MGNEPSDAWSPLLLLNFVLYSVVIHQAIVCLLWSHRVFNMRMTRCDRSCFATDRGFVWATRLIWLPTQRYAKKTQLTSVPPRLKKKTPRNTNTEGVLSGRDEQPLRRSRCIMHHTHVRQVRRIPARYSFVETLGFVEALMHHLLFLFFRDFFFYTMSPYSATGICRVNCTENNNAIRILRCGRTKRDGQSISTSTVINQRRVRTLSLTGTSCML